MKRIAAITLLRDIKPILMQQFGVNKLALFALNARNEASETSDVDILVTFDGYTTSKRYFGVQFYLEDCLNCPVDLVTDKALRPQLRPFIEQEAIYV